MQVLTERSCLLMQIMFKEPDLFKELIDGKDESYYSRVDIDQEKCEVVLGKTRFKWWNQLCGDEKTISLETFCFKASSMLGSKAENREQGRKIHEGLHNDIENFYRVGKSNDIIDRLFLVGYMGVKTGWSCSSLGVQGASDEPHNVRLDIHAGDRNKTFCLPGSGDKIVNIQMGVTGIDWLGD